MAYHHPRLLVFWDDLCVEDTVLEWERSANRRIGLGELADIIIEARKCEVHSFFTFFCLNNLFYYRQFFLKKTLQPLFSTKHLDEESQRRRFTMVQRAD